MPDTGQAQIIRNGAVVRDGWQVLRPAAEAPLGIGSLPAGPVIVPLAFWTANADALLARGEAAPWIASHEDPAVLAPWIPRLGLIAVDFPKFTDGRGFSTAFLLRSRLGYQGELRAIGDVLADQLFFMRRVGFDAYAVRADKDIHKALQVLTPFTDVYQGSFDNPVPAFRRHRRVGPEAGKAGS
ncbi:MAG TPA: DUF934 domain-containing protein [Burkholderiales bacterium]|nr:DUF934 domain-containing protein [Burkholderiales bacterium]